MDYVFSHFCGILCAALVALVIYGAARRETFLAVLEGV